MDKRIYEGEIKPEEPKEISFNGTVIDPESSWRRKKQMPEEDIKPEEPEYYKCAACGAKAGIMNKEVLWTVCPDCFSDRLEKKKQNLKHNVKYWAVPAYIIFVLVNILGCKYYADFLSLIDGIVLTAVLYSTTSKAVVDALSKINIGRIGFWHFIFKAGIILLGFFVFKLYYFYAMILTTFIILVTGIMVYRTQSKRLKKEEAEAQVCRTVQTKYLSKYDEYLQKLSVYEETHAQTNFSEVHSVSTVILGVADSEPAKPAEDNDEYKIELPADPEEIAPQTAAQQS